MNTHSIAHCLRLVFKMRPIYWGALHASLLTAECGGNVDARAAALAPPAAAPAQAAVATTSAASAHARRSAEAEPLSLRVRRLALLLWRRE
jgi:hypothetical protein